MAVAEVIGEPRRVQGVLAAHFQQLFGSGDDLDEAPIVQHIAVAGSEDGRLGKVDKEFRAADGLEHAPAPTALLVVENNRIGDGEMVVTGLAGATHGQILLMAA